MEESQEAAGGSKMAATATARTATARPNSPFPELSQPHPTILRDGGTPGSPSRMESDTPVGDPLTAAAPVTLLSEVRALLQALPTRTELTGQLSHMEERHGKDMADLKSAVAAITTSISSLESRHTELDKAITAVAPRVDAHEAVLRDLITHVDDLENRGRRNNVKVRGLPEDIGPERLVDTVRSIFNQYLGDPEGTHIELDRTHRVAGLRSQDRNRPRDILCRVHYYQQKEALLQRAWELGPLDYHGAEVTLLPDLSRRTLAMRRLLRPLLDASYRWGYPFHLIVRRGGISCIVRTPGDLPEVFKLLDIPDLPISDWTTPILPMPAARPAPGRRSPPAEQRRSRSPRREDPRPTPLPQRFPTVRGRPAED
ncbi:uncharacterized protein [Dendropsophus ebraccatus]|uniref:uncharacterized protein n=1 Tax=Dendropsophus ebraccatus TaxID=150705 RepID=UPI0038322612